MTRGAQDRDLGSSEESSLVLIVGFAGVFRKNPHPAVIAVLALAGLALVLLVGLAVLRCHGESPTDPDPNGKVVGQPVGVASASAKLPEGLVPLAEEAFASWVSGVMQRDRSIPNFVWAGSALLEALVADDPARGKLLSGAIGKYKWVGWCYLHEKSFVLIGEEAGEEYIACRVMPDMSSDSAEWTEVEAVGDLLTHERVDCCSPITTCFGVLINMCWCCCGFILPNCCCAWRWPCLQAHDDQYRAFPKSSFRRYWAYDAIEPRINTGDVLLFAGTFSTRIGGSSHWSHIGVAFRDVDGVQGPKGLLYVFEANFGRAGWDHSDLRLLREKCETYKSGATDVAWRPLDANPEERQKMVAAIQRHRGDPYDHDKRRMLMAALDCCPCCEMKKQERHMMFCSQTVAEVYQEAGVLPAPPEGPPSSEFLPRDFGLAYGGNAESGLLRAKFGDMHIVRRRKDKWTGLELL